MNVQNTTFFGAMFLKPIKTKCLTFEIFSYSDFLAINGFENNDNLFNPGVEVVQQTVNKYSNP